MSANPQPMTETDYLAFERNAEIKHEFIDGEVYAMAGASQAHIDITGNIFGTLFGKLAGSPCRPQTSDLRVRIAEAGYYAYPDVTVVCGERQLLEGEAAAVLLNPTVIFEVLSPGTESRDRGPKSRDYRALPSLQAYLLVAQAEAHVEFYRRAGDGWHVTDVVGIGAAIELAALGVTLTMSEIYSGVIE